jgi:hypothetical protein
MNKAYILLAREEAKLIERELTSRLTRAGNAMFCKRQTESGYEMYNPNTSEVVFKYVENGTSKYNSKVVDAHKLIKQ